jgi:hypothetical protein
MRQTARSWRVLIGGLCLCGTLLAAGCGGGKGSVTGKVLYKGQPVRGGNVSFVPEGGGGVMSSPIEEDGGYTIRNVPAGTVKITVETESFRPSTMQGGPEGGAPEFMKKYVQKKNPELADPQRAKRYVPIPAQYSDVSQSNLTFVVKRGNQEHDIDLK